MNFSWIKNRSNKVFLIKVNEKRELLETIDKRRGKMVVQLIRHDNILKAILEGKI